MVGLNRSCDEENKPFSTHIRTKPERMNMLSAAILVYWHKHLVTTSHIPVLVGQSTLSYRIYTNYPVRASMGQGNLEGPTAWSSVAKNA